MNTRYAFLVSAFCVCVGQVQLATAGVTPPPDPPLAISAFYTIPEDDPFSDILGASGGILPLTFFVLDPPDHGTLLVSSSSGAFTYDPVNGFLGPDSFLFNVRDPEGTPSNVAIVTFNIVNPPTSVPEPATLALLGFGLAGLAASRRRRNRHG